MKNFIIIPVCAVLLLAALARPAGAVTISAGPVAWFAWWNPVFEDQMSSSGAGSFKMNPSFLYGGTLSAGSGNWLVSSVFTMGGYHADSMAYLIGMTIAPIQSSQDIKKYDLDVTLNYKLSEIVKLYCGFKYQRYGWSVISAGMLTEMSDTTINAYGTGFGVSLNFHLSGNLYLLCNISAIYLANTSDTEGFLSGIGQFIPMMSSELDHAVGGNSTLSLAYYFEPISTTISLGFRYQYIYFLTKNSPALTSSGTPRDQFYGITLSAVYSFEI